MVSATLNIQKMSHIIILLSSRRASSKWLLKVLISSWSLTLSIILLLLLLLHIKIMLIVKSKHFRWLFIVRDVLISFNLLIHFWISFLHILFLFLWCNLLLESWSFLMLTCIFGISKSLCCCVSHWISVIDSFWSLRSVSWMSQWLSFFNLLVHLIS